MALLNIEDLTIGFGGIKAVSNLSLTVADNSFVGLMGPNGAGKTTVINCISRVYSPQKGRILFDSHDLLPLSGHQLTKLGISRTFQDLNFFNQIPDMSVIDYIRMGQFGLKNNSIFSDGLQTSSTRKKEWELKKSARRILEFFRQMRESMEPPQVERGYPVLYGREGFADLIDAENQPIDSLSFAWRRRLDLARALVSRPRLLLLDEPAQGLPPSEIENLSNLLRSIRQEFKVSALVVEHNMPMLMGISDSVIVMSSGEKLAEGTPDEVRANKDVIEVYLGTNKSDEQIADKAAAKIRIKAQNEEPILLIKDLDVYYGHAQALFSISLKLFPHQTVSVLGTNGSGKSTLLKAVSGLEKPTYGEIWVNGEYLPLGWPEIAAARGIQYVPQGHLIFPELSVLDNLKVGAYTAQKEKNYKLGQEVEKVFKYFPQLKELRKVLASKFSGGQKQMLAIGQALMAKPKILLLDEPSLGLAPIYIDALFSAIRKISEEEGCAILLVEQSVAKAIEVSDYIYMLNSGINSGQGPVEQFRGDISVVSKRLGFM